MLLNQRQLHVQFRVYGRGEIKNTFRGVLERGRIPCSWGHNLSLSPPISPCN